MSSTALAFLVGVAVAFALTSIAKRVGSNQARSSVDRFDLRSRVPCPCGDYPTLSERAGYEICILCNWEDDGSDDESDLALEGGVNHEQSLSTARIRFKMYRCVYTPEDERSNSPTEQEVKGLLMKAFDELTSCSEYERESVETEIACFERVLHAEVSRSVARYEDSRRHGT